MGMFDNVDFEIECPNPHCDEILKDFQTKDGPCNLGTLQVTDLSDGDTLYTKCPECRSWVQGVLHSRVKVIAVKVEASV